MSYITPTGFGKNVRLGSYKHINPYGVLESSSQQPPPQPEAQKNTCPVGSPYRINGKHSRVELYLSNDHDKVNITAMGRCCMNAFMDGKVGLTCYL